MKKLLLIICLLLSHAFTFAQCNDFYELSSTTEWEMESYNAKGKLTSRNHQKVKDFSKTATGFKAVVHTVMTNEKGKELSNGDLTFSCENGVLYIDMRNFIQEEQLKAYESYEMKIEASSLEYPSSLSIGQTLKDGTITISAANAPMAMKTVISITDRKVEGKESVTTPAGTFDCFKISAKVTVQSVVGVTMTFHLTSMDWIAPKVGTVKTESYNKNGKLNGSSLLTMRK
jgi:hypothetical protein